MSDATAQWLRSGERGTLYGLRMMGFFYRVVGRRICTALLHPIALYYFLASRLTRVALRDYQQRISRIPQGRAALGAAPSTRTAIRQIREFATQILDRFALWSYRRWPIEIAHEGSQFLYRLAEKKQGAILLGAHLGTYDMPRALASRYGLVLNVVMFTQHAQRITAFLREANPSSQLRVLELDPHSVRAGFAIKACIDRGELVAILADRVPPGGRADVQTVQFLGAPAAFVLSPFLLAGALGCPVLTWTCVRTGAARYEVRVEQLDAGGRVARSQRRAHAECTLEKYVRRLEQETLARPYQWFNFYPFWADAPEPSAAGGPAAPTDSAGER